jgi:hypothetical protein
MFSESEQQNSAETFNQDVTKEICTDAYPYDGKKVLHHLVVLNNFFYLLFCKTYLNLTNFLEIFVRSCEGLNK